MDQNLDSLIAGEPLRDLLPVVIAMDEQSPPPVPDAYGMCELGVTLPNDQLAPFCRALIRVEAELLVADAAEMAAAGPAHRSTNERQADALLCQSDLSDLGLHRARHLPLSARCWELRDNVTVYDASYVALAEFLKAILLTADERPARASGPR